MDSEALLRAIQKLKQLVPKLFESLTFAPKSVKSTAVSSSSGKRKASQLSGNNDISMSALDEDAAAGSVELTANLRTRIAAWLGQVLRDFCAQSHVLCL